MNWSAAATIVGILIVQFIAAVGVMLRVVQAFDGQVARVDTLHFTLEVIQKQISTIEHNTRDIAVIKDRQDTNIKRIERLENAVHVPTP